MAIEGPLKELGIHDVFQLLDLSRKTGVLRVTSQLRRNHGVIQFEKGAVVSAQVRSNPHPLGALLIKSGKITESDFELAKERQERGDKRRLGEILVALGAISLRELERQVRLQVEEVIFEVMGWREGYFSFTEGALASDDTEAMVRIPTEALLMEGARRIDEWSRIERQIPHLGIVPTLQPVEDGDEGQLDLLPPEWEVLAMIDGASDLRAIAGALGRSEFDVAKTVFGLESAGVVALHDPGTFGAADEPDSGELGDALTAIEGLLTRGAIAEARTAAEKLLVDIPRAPLAHLAVAAVELAAGRAAEAEQAVRRALGFDPLLAPAHRTLGDALALQGKFAEAAEWWQRWLTTGDHEQESVDRAELAAAVEAARTLDGVLRARHG